MAKLKMKALICHEGHYDVTFMRESCHMCVHINNYNE